MSDGSEISNSSDTKSQFRLVSSLIGFGVFALLSSSIWLAVRHFGNRAMAGTEQGDSMAGMDHSKMSHDEMMTVQGAFNAVPVQVETVQPRLLKQAVKYTGTVYPYTEVTVYPRIAGQLRNYGIYPGDRVRKGQLLAQLDASERRTQLMEAQSETEVMQKMVTANEMQIQEQAREISRMKAELDYIQLKAKRFKSLVAGGAISQNDYDVVSSEVSAKEAAISGAKIKLVRMQAEIRRDRAKVGQSQAKADTAIVLEGYTDIIAPVTGIVQARMADPGVVVRPGMGILKIGDYSRVRLRANIAQADAMGIMRGTRVMATVPGTKMTPIRGEVSSIFPDANPQTRTITVEAIVNNPGERLLAGQFLEMQVIKDSNPAAISVPQLALHTFQGKPAIWIVQGSGDAAMATRRVVKRGVSSGDRVEIITGLKAGEQVITSGFSRLLEGKKVAMVDTADKSVASLNQVDQGNVVIELVSPTAQEQVKAGAAELTLQVLDKQSKSPIPVKQLDVDVTMPMKNMAPMTTMVDVKALPKPGQFRVKTHFGMKGDWIIKTQIKTSEHSGRKQFTLTAR
ncbi:efflux RND transporter periplasmic adaptor subunit [Romeriopsis navalis]|nr:efflux RND transporter periplasmic adaptor subunit [Romeriopsis navalis]